MGTQRNLCLSPGPPQPAGGGGGGGTASKGSVPPRSAHKCILVIQMRSCHKGEGPALNKEPLGITAEGDEGPWSLPTNANASKAWEQLLWEQHRQGFVSRRLREASSYASLQECPAIPSWRNALGAYIDLPSHPWPQSQEKAAQNIFFHACSCNQTKTFLALLHPSAADARAHVHTG